MSEKLQVWCSTAGVEAVSERCSLDPLRPRNPSGASTLSGFFLPLLAITREVRDNCGASGAVPSSRMSRLGAWVRKVRARDSVMQSITDSLTEPGKDNAKSRCLRKPYAIPSRLLDRARHLGVLCPSAAAARAVP